VTSESRDALWQRLCEAGLAEGPVPEPGPVATPWPLRVMLGIAGWIGAIFLLGFAGTMFAMLFRDATAALPAGALCCGIAFVLFTMFPRNHFASQCGLAVSLAGQFLLGFGLTDWRAGTTGTFLAIAVVESVVAMALPNYLHRVIAAAAATAFFFLGMAAAGIPAVATAAAAFALAIVWLDQEQMASAPAVWEPLGYGLAIGLLPMEGSLLIGPAFWSLVRPDQGMALLHLGWLGPLAVGAVLAYVAWRLGARDPFTLGAAGVAALCGVASPGLCAGLLVLVLGFANGNRALMGLGIVASLGYLSHFYYDLHVTLLTKSMILIATGLALLAIRWLILRGRASA